MNLFKRIYYDGYVQLLYYKILVSAFSVDFSIGFSLGF